MAINTKTFLNKCNTIIKDSYANTGLNPVMELNYGKMITRGLIYFDHTKVQKMVEDKIYPDINKLHHVLHMTNSASVNDRNLNCGVIDSNYDKIKQRSVSFDLIFFLIPKEFDNGRGFDYVYDLYGKNHRAVSTDGSSWYQFKNYCKWDEEGIYTTEHLSKEVDLFTERNGSRSNIVIGYQHFDKGNENLIFDITEVFNKFITGELCNYGIGIAFSPKFEQTNTELSQYVGFFTQHTNSFYEPYIETTYDETIEDDRVNFYLDKDNKLYFYSIVGGQYANLDNLPSCTINGVEMVVKQCTKGVYYTDVNLSSNEYETDMMYYDIWSNIIYKGKRIDDVELEFVTKERNKYFTFGLPSEENKKEKIMPTLYGINNKENIKRGDIRKITVDCRIPYTSNHNYSINGIEYRLYTMQGENEIDVISYTSVERAYNSNFFYIKTNELIPSRYYIDIKVKYAIEELQHKNLIEFDIINDVTEHFQ